jgi:large subunit ribosomal protein L25
MSLHFFATITVHDRDVTKASVLSALRNLKKIPGIVYLKNKTNLPISVDSVHFEKLTEDPSFFTRIFELKYNEKQIFCIVKDVAFHPISGAVAHFDFMEVRAGDIIKVKVPIRVLNKDKCPGIKTGGDVYVLNYNVTLKCKVEAIPVAIDIDVEKSEIGDKFFLSDIKLPDHCTMIDDVILARIAGKRVIKDIAETQSAESAATDSSKETEGSGKDNKSEKSSDKK